MQQRANIDAKTVFTKEYTPSEFAKQLPSYAHRFSHFIASKNYFTERKEYPKYLMIFTNSGKGFLKYRGKEYEARKGQMIFIDCKEYQYYGTKSEEPWDFYWIHIEGKSVATYFQLLFQERFDIIQITDVHRVKRVFEEIFSLELNYTQSYELALSGYINELLTLTALSNVKERTAITGGKVQASVNYIMEHFDEKIKTDDLAAKAGFSRYHFIRLFKLETGETPYEFITRFRINQSKQFLNETDLTLDELSLKSGFRDVNSYIRAFKKLTGITPHKYRNRS